MSNCRRNQIGLKNLPLVCRAKLPSLLLLMLLLTTMHGVLPTMAGESDCPYLTNTDVEVVTGRKLEFFKMRGTPLPDDSGMICDSELVYILVLNGEGSVEKFEEMLKNTGRGLEQRTPVEGVADGAYTMTLEPRQESERLTAMVVAHVASHLAAVSVRVESGKSSDVSQAEAIELAKIVLSHLK